MNVSPLSEDPKKPRFAVFVQGDALLFVNQTVEKVTLEEAQERSTALSKAILQLILNRYNQTLTGEK